jgi:hypothetical protein
MKDQEFDSLKLKVIALKTSMRSETTEDTSEEDKIEVRSFKHN